MTLNRPNECNVSLHDGREVSNYSDDFRHECECSWILANKPTPAQKYLYLYGVMERHLLFTIESGTGREVIAEAYRDRTSRSLTPSIYKMRGLEAADQLLADMKRLHAARQEKKE